MLSFLNDPRVKRKYLARVRAHAKADEIVQGLYWENGKGCAVGCTIHSRRHNAYEIELGLPMWLAVLEDTLFENLPNNVAKTFPAAFLQAIPVGVSLAVVRAQFCLFLMQENAIRVEALRVDNELKKQAIAAIAQCQAAHEEYIKSGVYDISAMQVAESAAWEAAASMRVAAGAVWSVVSAPAQACSAAESAAMKSAACVRYADHLLKLLKETRGDAPPKKR